MSKYKPYFLIYLCKSLLTTSSSSPPVGNLCSRPLADVSEALKRVTKIRVHSFTLTEIQHAVALKGGGVNVGLTAGILTNILYKGVTED